MISVNTFRSYCVVAEARPASAVAIFAAICSNVTALTPVSLRPAVSQRLGGSTGFEDGVSPGLPRGLVVVGLLAGFCRRGSARTARRHHRHRRSCRLGHRTIPGACLGMDRHDDPRPPRHWCGSPRRVRRRRITYRAPACADGPALRAYRRRRRRDHGAHRRRPARRVSLPVALRAGHPPLRSAWPARNPPGQRHELARPWMRPPEPCTYCYVLGRSPGLPWPIAIGDHNGAFCASRPRQLQQLP
jgi:hypothetical protein